MHRLGVFAKHWTPGQVKTRLATRLGAERAAALHEQFLRTTLVRFAEAADEQVLAFAPAAAAQAFLSLDAPSWQLVAQGDGNLGQRMQRFFRESFEAGASRVVLIGSDSPNLPRDFVDEAFALLEESRVVLGPAADGGYYLVGAADDVPPIFSGIDWSTASVWPQTMAHLAASNTPCATLPSWYDVDEFADLERLQADLASIYPADPALAELQVFVAASME